MTQRQMEQRTDYSLGLINRTVKELVEMKALSEGRVTPLGYELLEPYKVRRAVFIAAGFGTRMVPLTFNTPKPLIRVHGERIIDGLIDACLQAGIDEIYIVRGYLAEQFDQLLYKYPMLKFLENIAYNDANNISSAMCARYLLQGAYVFEADLLLYRKELVKKYQYQSNYLGIYRERTDDWCFIVKDGLIREQKIGGMNCYQEIGISFWSPKDGARLADDLKRAYEMPGGKELYWDQTVFSVFKDHYQISIRECTQEDIVEIDTFKELKAVDPTYNV
ncbi:MAG: phosphocholine cytidylyltransferase family protein [Oscillospiraceae bacterium]|nr:phosphocholine cytidylyltransferase family protein [Oscillospiraceae bacterium]